MKSKGEKLGKHKKLKRKAERGKNENSKMSPAHGYGDMGFRFSQMICKFDATRDINGFIQVWNVETKTKIYDTQTSANLLVWGPANLWILGYDTGLEKRNHELSIQRLTRIQGSGFDKKLLLQQHPLHIKSLAGYHHEII